MPVFAHKDLTSYEMHGNLMMGLSTRSRGATQVEAWYTEVAPGAASPLHVHSHEEVIVVLQGKGELVLDGVPHAFEAPCTVLAPPNTPHVLRNLGDGALVAVAAMPLETILRTPEGAPMELPWRR